MDFKLNLVNNLNENKKYKTYLQKIFFLKSTINNTHIQIDYKNLNLHNIIASILFSILFNKTNNNTEIKNSFIINDNIFKNEIFKKKKINSEKIEKNKDIFKLYSKNNLLSLINIKSFSINYKFIKKY